MLLFFNKLILLKKKKKAILFFTVEGYFLQLGAVFLDLRLGLEQKPGWWHFKD